MTHAPPKRTGISMAGTDSTNTVDHWVAIMKKFTNSQKEKCRAIPSFSNKIQKGLTTFPTDSTYDGTWNVIGMKGHGVYTFPKSKVYYEGNFEDGNFHGEGNLVYSDKSVLKGKWFKGQCIERKLIFNDGLQYNSEGVWGYCRPNDRRYKVELDNDLQPAGATYITNQQPPPEIPLNHYDVGDGFFDTETSTVYKHDDLTALVRHPDFLERLWILDNCRQNPTPKVGPDPNLYEEWVEPELERHIPPVALLEVIKEHAATRKPSDIMSKKHYDEDDLMAGKLFYNPSLYARNPNIDKKALTFND